MKSQALTDDLNGMPSAEGVREKIQDGIWFLHRLGLEPGYLKLGWEAMKAITGPSQAMTLFWMTTLDAYPEVGAQVVAGLPCLPSLAADPFFVNVYPAGGALPDDRELPEARYTITRVREGSRIPGHGSRLRFFDQALGSQHRK